MAIEEFIFNNKLRQLEPAEWLTRYKKFSKLWTLTQPDVIWFRATFRDFKITIFHHTFLNYFCSIICYIILYLEIVELSEW